MQPQDQNTHYRIIAIYFRLRQVFYAMTLLHAKKIYQSYLKKPMPFLIYFNSSLTTQTSEQIY